MFTLPQYLQYVHDRSVVTAGLLLTPLGVGAGLAARYNASVAAALGARWTFGRPRGDGRIHRAAPVALGDHLSRGRPGRRRLIGVLIAIAVPAATTVIMNDLGEEKAGDGGAVNQLARQVGGALGVAIIGTVFAALLHQSDR